MLTPGEYMGETRIKPAKLWFITMVIFAKDYIRVLIVIQMSNRNHIYTGKLDFLWQSFCSELVPFRHHYVCFGRPREPDVAWLLVHHHDVAIYLCASFSQ